MPAAAAKLDVSKIKTGRQNLTIPVAVKGDMDRIEVKIKIDFQPPLTMTQLFHQTQHWLPPHHSTQSHLVLSFSAAKLMLEPPMVCSTLFTNKTQASSLLHCVVYYRHSIVSFEEIKWEQMQQFGFDMNKVRMEEKSQS
ncbi:uncharacterized protein UDID_17252 [Ustilago sp. UG-2017a]|nr:uncharacterized protein UDID_17252 [Ustilago sp. UG-2017a]